ncbi:MAG TPA: ribosome maturation factor RimP [Acidimicrobiales bacterium]
MSVSERVRAVIEPVVAAQDLELFDLEQVGGVLRVTVDRAGGVDMEAISRTTRALSRALDEHDPIASQYTLEVSSPGLERPLRTAAHFAWAVGKDVSVKTLPDHPVGRRLSGTVVTSDDDTVTIQLAEPNRQGDASVTLGLGDIEKARTTFSWGPAPKPGGPKPKPKSKSESKSKSTPTEKKVQP